MAGIRELFGAAAAPPSSKELQAGEPIMDAPQKSFFEELLGDAARVDGLTRAQREDVLQYFATDSCERLLLLEKHLRGNEDIECFEMLGVIRQRIAERTRSVHIHELQEQVRQRAKRLTDEDERHILCGSVFQLLAEDPEEAADRALLYTMLRMVRHGGPFVDMARRKERAWHEARLIWWVLHGVRLEDMRSAYTDEASAGVPEEASLGHGIRTRSE